MPAVDDIDIGRGAMLPRQARQLLDIPFSFIAGTFSVEHSQVAHGFNRGDLLSSKTAGLWVLASNDDREKQAHAICVKALADVFWFATIYGLPFELIGHGLVIAAPPLHVGWLGVAGAITMTQPFPTAEGVIQQVAIPLTTNLISLTIGTAQIV